MPTRAKICWNVTTCRIACLFLCYALATGAAESQVPQQDDKQLAYAADPANVPDAIKQVKAGNIQGPYLDMIARAGAVEAVPILKDQFAQTQDPLDKTRIASALVRLDKNEDTYWSFLVEQVTQAVESDAPNYVSYDVQGKALPNNPTPEFVAWAKAHGLSIEEAEVEVSARFPGAVLLMGVTGDPRGIPLLRRALLSQNPMIEAVAAEGLAQIKDEDSVPLIIEACNKAPADTAAMIAVSLVYFDDSAAQNAVDKFVPKDLAALHREARAQGRTPFR